MKKIFFLLTFILLLTSCANKAMTRYEELTPILQKEGFDGVIQTVQEKEDDLYGEKSRFLYHFDLGTLYHYNRNFKESIKHFAEAEKIYEDLYTKSVSNEAAAVLTNDNVRPYRARPFELLSLYEFQILNYLAIMDLDGALVEVRRSQIAMQSLYQKDNQKVNDNGYLRYLSALIYDLDGAKDDAAIAYANTIKAYDESNLKLPREVYEFATEGLRYADRDDELKKFNKPILESTPQASAAREMGGEIIVIGYAGHSPILGESYFSGTYVSGGVMNIYAKDGGNGGRASFTIVAPIIPNATGKTFHIGFALPEVRRVPNRVHHFEVSINGSHVFYPEKVVAFDEELIRNMKDEESTTLMRTILRVATRTVTAQLAKSATNTDNELFNLFKNIAVDVGQSQLEQADLRVGLFLPNSLYMTRIPVKPGTHNVNVHALSSNGGRIESFNFDKIKVKQGQKIFLFVPSIK